ncbi:hypothetical protein OEA41_008868 [Lepraria neglecta]|uniref:DUF2423 domain-containing protein n=1 Tax=Lepraria neglecta TaxID=209136 RepID=A0AAD9Z1F1_9LECA|nr:hypothetical protein OEA41_008868 [Lepraria neglecta]
MTARTATTSSEELHIHNPILAATLQRVTVKGRDRSMAKGLRSSRNKTNNLKLRSKVFGPVEDARKERLSAKLLELASKPIEKTEEDAKMIDDDKDSKQPKETESEADLLASEGEMDLDQADTSTNATNSGSRSSGRIQKKGRGKARAAMVFPVYKKGRRVGPQLSKRQRRKSLRP